MTTEIQTPAERWNLREDARVTVADTEYVIYSDECYAWAIEAEAFDRPTEEDDYSEWCVGDGSGVGDDELRQAIADASGRLIYTAGVATPVQPRAAAS